MKADYEWQAINETGNAVSIDMYAGAEKKAQSPMELLLSAVSACAAVDMVQMMKKKRRTVQDLQIETVGNRQEDYPQYYQSIHMHFVLFSPDATAEEFEKVVKLSVEKYCSVSASLRSEITFSCEVKA